MQYLGGKARIAKALCAYLESRREGRYFVEPFCGGLNITIAPVDFKCVWSVSTVTDMHGAGRAGRTEKLFEYRP